MSTLTPETVADFIPRESKFDEDLLRPITITGEEALDVFVDQYYKLQQALKKAHENEQRFISKCKSLAKQIKADSQKLTTLISLHESDKKKKVLLREEIDQRKQQKDVLMKELETMVLKGKGLRADIAKLTEMYEDSQHNESILKAQQKMKELEELAKQQQDLKDKERAELNRQSNRNIELANKLLEYENTARKSAAEIDDLELKIKENNAKVEEELGKKAELDQQLGEVRQQKVKMEISIVNKRQVHEKAEGELKVRIKKMQECDQILQQQEIDIKRLENTIEDVTKSIGNIQKNNKRHDKQKEEELKVLGDEKQICTRLKTQAEEKKGKLQELKIQCDECYELSVEAEKEKQFWQEQLRSIKERIEGKEGQKQVLKLIEKEKDNYVRAREVLSQSHNSKVEQIRRDELALKIAKSTMSNIKNEYMGYLLSIRNLNKVIEALRQDKALHEEELKKRKLQKSRAEEELIDRQLKISQLQQQIVENEEKLHKQQNLLEQATSERNFFRKNFIETTAETLSAKVKAQHLGNMIRRLHDEIREKQQTFMREHVKSKHVKQDIGNIEDHNKATDDKVTDKENRIKEQSEQVRKLSTIIADADEELRVQRKQYNTVVNEQRVLNQQLIKRNDEVARVYEHLKLQNSLLKKSAQSYQEKTDALSAFRRARDELSVYFDLRLQDIGRYSELKQTMAEIQKELLAEKLKVNALTEELRKPINVHRWKRLQDTNTDMYNMIKKVRMLQKAIIKKSALVGEKDELIQQKEKLYVDLRRVLARQPGTEAVEQLRLYAATLRDKKSKYKAMKSELKMFQAKVYEYKYDIQKLQQDLQVIKLEYFAKKKRQMQQNQVSDSRASMRSTGDDDGSMGAPFDQRTMQQSYDDGMQHQQMYGSTDGDEGNFSPRDS